MKGEQVLVKTRTNLNYKRNKECPVLLPKISESNEHLERKEGRREWGREGGRGRESFEGKKYKATSFKEVNRYFQLWNNLIEFLNRKKKRWGNLSRNNRKQRPKMEEVHEDRMKAMNDEEFKEESNLQLQPSRSEGEGVVVRGFGDKTAREGCLKKRWCGAFVLNSFKRRRKKSK